MRLITGASAIRPITNATSPRFPPPPKKNTSWSAHAAHIVRRVSVATSRSPRIPFVRIPMKVAWSSARSSPCSRGR
jgi:hypothetical protein